MKFTVFVFARLKHSQVRYKIVPLSNSEHVNKVYVLRKTPLDISEEKIECISLPRVLRVPPFYWIFTVFYGTFLIKKYKANLILSYNIFPHGFNGYFSSLLTRIPFIYAEIIEDTTIFYRQKVKKFIIKKILKRAKRILVPGSITGDFWEKQGYNKTYQLHSTVDPDYFKPNPSVEKVYDFIFVGVFDDRKRPDLIINSFNLIKISGHSDIKLCMVGFGELKGKIKDQVSNLGLQNYIDFVETNDALQYFLKSKILVMASLAEGIPCAMMEAMSCELIVVVPPVGDIADVVEHKHNGFLHNNSSDDLNRFMAEAYLNYNNLVSMKKNARKTIVAEHSYQFATSRWNNLLKNI